MSEISTIKRRERLQNIVVPLHPQTRKEASEMVEAANQNTREGDINLTITEVYRYAIEFAFSNPRFRSMVKNRII